MAYNEPKFWCSHLEDILDRNTNSITGGTTIEKYTSVRQGAYKTLFGEQC